MWLSQWRGQLLAIGLFVICYGTATPSNAEIRTEFLMDFEPKLNIPDPVKHFSPALKSLWLEALERPDADMQRLAAETVARGHQYGVPDLMDAVPRLETILQADKSHTATRFAAARALIVLESRDSSDELFQASQKYEADLRQLIEPALAKWSSAKAITLWKARLENPETRSRDLILALRGLAQVRDSTATPLLLSIIHDESRSADIRLEAAAAAGQCAASGLEPDAARLAHRKSRKQSVHSICACRLLARHTSEEARTLLIELTGHPQSSVAACAFNQLLEIDSSLVLPLVETALNHTDPTVRRAGASACLAHPTPERIASVARLLADPHPSVRREVCEKTFRLSDQSLLIESIRASAVTLLSQEAWQGQEQAALLVGMLEHQPASNRLIELLESPRAEVGISSAWALRKIAVPETIPGIIDKVQRQTERRRHVNDPLLDEQVAHLCEALGVLKADNAIPLLERYIPKDPYMGDHSRCAAIWAIGFIREAKRDAELEDKLRARIRDFSDVDPEVDSVKEKCAVTLARMKAVDLAPEMRGIAESDAIGTRLGVALRWAVKEMTGDDLPPVKPPRLPSGNWFLEPYNR